MRRNRLRLAALALLMGASAWPAASAQDLVRLLQQQRRQAVLEAASAEVPPPEPRGLVLFSTTDPVLRQLDAHEARKRFVADSLAQSRADSLEAARILADSVLVWDKVQPGSQDGFIADYREAFWRAVPSGSPVDTMSTLELRGRLTQRFGTPTRNAAAARQERYAGSEHVQFEYWFVVNDTLPLLVMDTHGPFGRGLLIAGDERQLGALPRVKAALAHHLLTAPPTVEFVDYYHDEESGRWFKTGYDGEAFFTRPVRRPRWSRNFVGEKWLIHR